VTLNIAAVHPECVYVAADFRLSRMIGRQFSAMDEPSMKGVRFSYPMCSGLITYTGFGAGRDGADTAVHVTRWLEGMRDLDITELIAIIRDKGDQWLRRLRPFPFNHTFSVAGFQADHEAVLAMISNFQSMHGPTQAQPSTSLTVSMEATRRRAIVRVTGVPGVVPRERERLLRRTVDTDALDSARIKQAMMNIIARASTSPRSNNLISAESSAISLLPGGSGRQNFSEPMDIELHHVFNGIVTPSSKSLLTSLGAGQRKIIESLFVGPGPAPYYQQRCRPSHYQGGVEGAYELIEIAIPGSPPYSGRAIDGDGTVLASSASDDNAAYRQLWLYRSPDNLERIPLPEPTAYDSGGLDARGFVYLCVGTPGRAARLARWNGTELTLLPAVADNGSGPSWISPSSWVAGHVEVSRDNSRADRQQPARWNPEGQLQRTHNIPEGVAGTAMSVAADGTALVELHRDLGLFMSYVWRTDGSLQPLGLPIGSMATGITDEHAIIGFREDPLGRTAIISTDMTNWVPLGTPAGWDPTRVAPDGTVTGFTRVEGFMHPWIRQADGTSMMLPGYHRHQCSIVGISPRGDAVGTAHADHCTHALVWKKLT
jgi:hypothetical protein